jgi:cytochrome c peroxidase
MTAPYMHNGVFNTLEEVMDFYNKGGGAGTHTAPENQTLPPDELHLDKNEIKSIISFMRTLTETSNYKPG